LAELLSARSRLLHELPRSLTSDERQFLRSLASAEPRWELLDVEHAQQLPAIKWKVQNLQKLARENKANLHEQADALDRRFEGIKSV
jgi:hypothetical protein